MLFNSLEFLVFFTVVLCLFAALPRGRWTVLLLASYVFYAAWRWEYLGLILLSTAVDYWCGRRMGEVMDGRLRKRYLRLSILSNLGLLFTFKYLGFFGEIAAELSGVSFPGLKLLLPVGISFYTFQTLSYSIDVYQRRIQPERHAGYFALYVTYFPQLVAGPIERAGDLIGQFRTRLTLDWNNLYLGAQQVGWGLFKKVVIADRLALLVDPLFAQPEAWSSPSLAAGVVFFGMQIYCDFSGYTDMAIGLSRCFGVKLSRNFDRPYFARSLGGFWNRWHITLSHWFRDYVYIPLGGNRVVKWRWSYNLMLTFLLSGLWHGAAWTFVIWGAIHGGYLLFERAVFGKGNSGGWLRWLLTFMLIHVAWIFFRADDLPQAAAYLEQLCGVHLADLWSEWAASGVSKLDALLALLLTAGVYLKEALYRVHKPFALKLMFWLAVLFGILVFGVDGSKAFIYFQF